MLNADWGCCRRKQSSSEGGDLAPDRKIENIIYQCDDTEHSTMGAGRTDARALTVQTIYCKQRRTRRLKFLPLYKNEVKISLIQVPPSCTFDVIWINFKVFSSLLS